MNYEQILSQRIQNVKPSGIRRFFDILEEMKDAISLGIGEPDFVRPRGTSGTRASTPSKRASPNTPATPVLAELRREIASLPGAPVRPALSTLPTRSSSPWAAARASTLPSAALWTRGTRSSSPCPPSCATARWWSMAGGTPVYLETKAENEFRLTPDELRSAITAQDQGCWCCPSPTTPPAASWSGRTWRPWPRCCGAPTSWSLSDEIYAELTYGEHATSPWPTCPICTSAPSWSTASPRAYAMTGWRHGLRLRPARPSSPR